MADFGPARQEFHIGLGTVAAPGMMRGIAEIHADLATVPLRELVAPACRHATERGRPERNAGVPAGRGGADHRGEQGVALDLLQRRGAGAARACRRAFGEPGARRRPGGDRHRGCGLSSIVAKSPRRWCPIWRPAAISKWDDLAGYRVQKREPLALGVSRRARPDQSSAVLRRRSDRLSASIMLRAHDPGAGALRLGRAPRACSRRRWRRRRRRVSSIPSESLVSLDAVLRRALGGSRSPGDARAFRGTTHVSVIDGAGNIASATVLQRRRARAT